MRCCFQAKPHACEPRAAEAVPDEHATQARDHVTLRIWSQSGLRLQGLGFKVQGSGFTETAKKSGLQHQRFKTCSGCFGVAPTTTLRMTLLRAHGTTMRKRSSPTNYEYEDGEDDYRTCRLKNPHRPQSNTDTHTHTNAVNRK